MKVIYSCALTCRPVEPGKVRLATRLKREWLDKADLRESELLQFDKDKLAITARRQLSILGLVLRNPNRLQSES